MKIGEFSQFLEHVNQNLIQAIKYTDDENQIKMLSSYIEFFETGDFKHFEIAQQYSLNICQNIDLYLGWVDSIEIRRRFFVIIVLI